jgi:polyhydroxybutyrate depolymerase
VLLAVLVAAVILSACGSSGAVTSTVTTVTTGATTASSTTLATGTTTGVTGCGTAAASGSTTMTPTVEGHRRTVIVHVPKHYNGSDKVALVLNMHGSGGTALEQEGLTGMDATSDADGFIVAYPQGLIPSGSGFDWNVPNEPLFGNIPVPAGAADDITFLTQLVQILEHDYCINPARVYATGISGGGRTASQLACDESKVFAAVAPVSGLRRNGRPGRPL